MLCVALFNRNISLFLPCGTMFPHGSYLAGDVDEWRASDRIKAAEIAWTQVHAIINCITCRKWRFKWRRSEGSPIATWRHEESPSPSKVRPHDRDLTATRRPIFFYSRRRSGASDSDLTAAKTGGRMVRSRRDRAAIVAPSEWNHFHSIGRRETCDQDLDHGPIVARSQRDRGLIVA